MDGISVTVMSLVEYAADDDGVRVITINDPDRRNALNWPLLNEFRATVDRVAVDSEARAVVVQGNGKAFCAGADLSNLFGDLDRDPDVLRENLLQVYASFLGLADLTVPTVAAVHGAAVGAGLNIALACDVIIAGPRARFGPTFSQIGLHPGGGCTWLLTRRIGTANTAAALYNGDTIDADSALRLGIAQELTANSQQRARELATAWASRDPQLMASIKSTVAFAATADLASTVAVEAGAQAESLRSQQFREFAAQFQPKKSNE